MAATGRAIMGGRAACCFAGVALPQRLRWRCARAWCVTIRRGINQLATSSDEDLAPAPCAWRSALSCLGRRQAEVEWPNRIFRMLLFAGSCHLSVHACAAPEQMLGDACTLAADIYSLGILMIELTTQQIVYKRGAWRLPRVPEECPEVCVCVCVGVHACVHACLQPGAGAAPAAACWCMPQGMWAGSPAMPVFPVRLAGGHPIVAHTIPYLRQPARLPEPLQAAALGRT